MQKNAKNAKMQKCKKCKKRKKHENAKNTKNAKNRFWQKSLSNYPPPLFIMLSPEVQKGIFAPKKKSGRGQWGRGIHRLIFRGFSGGPTLFLHPPKNTIFDPPKNAKK